MTNDCGAVGQFAMISAYMMGAERAIAINRFRERLEMARKFAKAETINYEEVDAGEALKEMTGGRGPDRTSTSRLPHFSTEKRQLYQSCSSTLK